MAGAGYKLFNTGDVLTAAQVNTYLMQQTVMVFASATARTTALSGVLAEGMVSYLQDTNALEVYDGSSWVASAAGDITAVTAGTGISGGGTSGAVTITNSMATEITAAGDIIVGTGSGTFDNLPIGTTGQVLTADTTVSPYKVKWATASGGSSGPAFRAYPSGAQSFSSGTYTKLSMDTETFDTDSCYNTTDKRFTPNKAGYYQVNASAFLSAGSASTVILRLYKNGSNNSPDLFNNANTNNQGILTIASDLIYLNGSTDYIELYAYHGGSSPVMYTDASKWSATWIRS
jgi:hypothetical protein